MHSSIRRAVVLTGLAGLATVGLQVSAAPAYAHDNVVAGVATCQKNGTYTVTWYVRNTNTDESENATVTGFRPAQSHFSLMSGVIPGHGTGATVQSGIPGNATQAAVLVHGHWYPDNFQKDAYGAVNLPGTCVAPPKARTAKPATPGVRQSVCTGGRPTSPVLTTRRTTGVSYSVAPAGPYRAGQRVTVTATAAKGYRLDRSPAWTGTRARASRTMTFDRAPVCRQVAARQVTRPQQGPLANTGPHTLEMLATGLGLIALGGVALAAARRRV